MIRTILFDLDGTLLPMDQEEFINAYFYELMKKMAKVMDDPSLLKKLIWAGTKAMIENDGRRTNREVFFEFFKENSDLDDKLFEYEFLSFYQEEFGLVKRILGPSFEQKEMLKQLREKHYRLILATNPIFPRAAIRARLSWINLQFGDFDYVTTYENSHYCKPNIAYYKEIFQKMNCTPDQCLMIGNNTIEDMCVAKLNADTFLLTDYLEGKETNGIDSYQHGNVMKLKEFLDKLPIL